MMGSIIYFSSATDELPAMFIAQWTDAIAQFIVQWTDAIAQFIVQWTDAIAQFIVHFELSQLSSYYGPSRHR